MPTYFFSSNGQQEIDDGYLDEIFDEPKTPEAITLGICDIKPAYFKIFSRKLKY